MAYQVRQDDGAGEAAEAGEERVGADGGDDAVDGEAEDSAHGEGEAGRAASVYAVVLLAFGLAVLTRSPR